MEYFSRIGKISNEALMRVICREIKVNIFFSNLKYNIFTPKLLDIYFPQETNFDDHKSVKGIYLVFTYYRQTLHHILRTKDFQLQKKEVIVFIYNFLCAMKFIHNSNVVHRDLKPTNILVTNDLEVIIADFGLARSIKQINSQKLERKRSHKCFTRYYRPPEVIMGIDDYDERADLWSIGCIIFEVIQKMMKSCKSPQILFKGDSCYPHSPVEMNSNDSQSSEIKMSSDDQLIKIVESLDIEKKDINFV